MLTIVDGIAVARLPGCQQIGVTAAADRPRLEAEHSAHTDTAGPGTPAGHAHDPVDAARLVCAAMLFGRFVDELQEQSAVRHQLPGASLGVGSVHRRPGRQPGSAGAVARVKQAYA